MIDDQTKTVKGRIGMLNERCRAVKPRVNDMLDFARHTYRDMVLSMEGFVFHFFNWTTRFEIDSWCRNYVTILYPISIQMNFKISGCPHPLLIRGCSREAYWWRFSLVRVDD